MKSLAFRSADFYDEGLGGVFFGNVAMGLVLRVCVGLAVCVCASVVEMPSARGDTYTDHVASILQHGWKSTPNALDLAQLKHAEAVRLNAADPRADYALALVHMRRSNWEEATDALSAATNKDRSDLYAWRAHLWLLVYQRQFDAALAEMASLAATFSQPPADAAAQSRRQAAAKIMGRVYGYLAGPREGDVDDAVLQRQQSLLIAKLGDGDSAAFEAGRRDIAAQHQKMLAEIDAEKANTLAENQAALDEGRQQAESEAARIEADYARLQEQAAEAKNALDEQNSQFESELSPIRRAYADVEARARPFQLRIGDLRARLSSALAETNLGEGKDEEEKRRNRERRERAQREVDRLRFELRREEEFLRPLINDANRLQAEANAVERRRQAAVAGYQTTYAQLSAQARTLERTGKLLKAKLRELERGAGSTSGKTYGMQARLKQWPTYEPFPLDAERDRLLKATK